MDAGLRLVVCALVPAIGAAQADPLGERIQQALDSARPALVSHLRQALDQPTSAGQLGLLCLAALHDGMEPPAPPLADALARLLRFASNELQTYDLALRLLVLEVHAQAPERADLARRDSAELLRHREHGLFSYGRNPGTFDLSNTQYAVLGLRAAAAIGVPIQRSVWSQIAAGIQAAQKPDGGFAYGGRGDDSPSYPSMTAAGLTVLEVCRQQLEQGGRSLPELERDEKRGWKWLDKHHEAIGDRNERWSYYWHYGLERAAILADVTEVGGVDWYRTGAKMLLDEQADGGGWNSATDMGPVLAPGVARGRGAPVATAFAILFLRRKFQKVAGPLTQARVPILAQLGEQASSAEVQACADGLVARGKAAMVEVLTALRSEVGARRRAAALALQAIAGQDFGYDPEAGEEANRLPLRGAEKWWLQHRGGG
jgi:hypothetical protein